LRHFTTRHLAIQQSKHVPTSILFGIQRTSLGLIVDLDPSPLLMRAIREWPLPTPLALGSRQPQSQKMTTRGWGSIVGVCRPRVEDVGYRDERRDIISHRRTRSRSPRTHQITYYLPRTGCPQPLRPCAKTIAERSVQTLRLPLSAFPTSPGSTPPRRGARSTSQSKGHSWTRPCRRGSRRPETRHRHRDQLKGSYRHFSPE
jgi:hypothetical protein